MQTMKESPLLHIAKYHILQHLQVSQHYSSAEIKCPRVSHIKRKCRQFSILKHVDFKASDGEAAIHASG